MHCRTKKTIIMKNEVKTHLPIICGVVKNQEDNQRRYIRLGSNVTPGQKERYINKLISYLNKSNHENRVTNIDLKQLKELKRWLTETVSQGCKGMSVHISLKSGF